MRDAELKPFFDKSPDRVAKVSAALSNGSAQALYSALAELFSHPCDRFVPRYEVQDKIYVRAESGTTGLFDQWDDPAAGSQLYLLSQELSLAIFRWNAWYEFLAGYRMDSDSNKKIPEIPKEEWDSHQSVGQRLADEVKKQAPDCRVYSITNEPERNLVESVLNPEGKIERVGRGKRPPLSARLAEFLYESEPSELVQVDDRTVQVFNAKE